MYYYFMSTLILMILNLMVIYFKGENLQRQVFYISGNDLDLDSIVKDSMIIAVLPIVRWIYSLGLIILIITGGI